MAKVILDLCSGSGNWSAPYAENGYEVIRVDLPTDVRLIHKSKTPVYGILAAPPCNCFAGSAVWVKRTPDEYKLALSIVDACLRAVVIYRPVFWALENPRGILSRWLGRPVYTFDPCDFGEPWTKRTNLWGQFNPPIKSPVESWGTLTNQPGRRSCGDKANRAKTPEGFARAFFAANP